MEQIHPNMATLPSVTNEPQAIKIFLHGKLRAFAPSITLIARDAVQALSGIASQHEGFAKTLRCGRYTLIAGSLARGKALTGADLIRPLPANKLHLVPAVRGAGKGRGKAVLGLTLLGLSFVPGANAAIGGAFSSVGAGVGTAATEASFQQFGSQLLGRAGGLLLLAGAAEMLSPQVSQPAGSLPSSAQATPETSGQGAPIPLVYGNARIVAPIVISSGLDVENQ